MSWQSVTSDGKYTSDEKQMTDSRFRLPDLVTSLQQHLTFDLAPRTRPKSEDVTQLLKQSGITDNQQ
jgi:hypothetical protein